MSNISEVQKSLLFPQPQREILVCAYEDPQKVIFSMYTIKQDVRQYVHAPAQLTY